MIISLLSLGIKTETKKLKSYKKTHVRWSKPAVPAIAFYPVHVAWLIFVGFSLKCCKFTSQRKKERFWNSEEVPSHGTEVFRVSMGKDMGCSKGMPMDMRGTFQKGNLFIKNCVFILTCLNFSHLQNTLRLMQCTYWDMFYIAQTSFWTCRVWCLLVLLPFLFHLFHMGKMFPFEDLFHTGKQTKKVTRGQHLVNRDGGSQGSCPFWSKTATTLSTMWAGAR